MKSDVIRVVVVDDHPLFRDGVVMTLQHESDMHIVGQGGSAADAIHLATTVAADVMLLDLNLPGGGIHALREVTRSNLVTRVVMLTVSEDEADVLAALKNGARGYVIKGVTGPELRDTVRSVHAGEVRITPVLASGLLFELAGVPRGPSTDPLDELTSRERQILEGVAAGHSNKEIARDLGLTEKTVKHYMTSVLQKLQVRNRVEAALLAQRERRRER
ncbi:LuxR C-terminal-related transcriptional regulator [Deinococcus pimensis]|uniref:LuxR C-terminal-related transcriptional regulator n=1 Tax=Deinococcus pimensis TaxID=309888 RepID=UPI0004850049|nr:response regulator transcription factor [Deinococcus pimensis]